MSQGDEWFYIEVEAEVFLLPSSESGREKGITSGYRPNHNFGSETNTEMRMGRINVINDEWIEPGQTKLTIINFAMPSGYLVDLKPGTTWRIQEAGKLVGHGTIIQIISSNAQG